MLCKKRLCKINQIRNDTVIRVSPKGCKFKTVAGLPLLGIPRIGILYGVAAGRV